MPRRRCTRPGRSLPRTSRRWSSHRAAERIDRCALELDRLITVARPTRRGRAASVGRQRGGPGSTGAALLLAVARGRGARSRSCRVRWLDPVGPAPARPDLPVGHLRDQRERLARCLGAGPRAGRTPGLPAGPAAASSAPASSAATPPGRPTSGRPCRARRGAARRPGRRLNLLRQPVAAGLGRRRRPGSALAGALLSRHRGLRRPPRADRRAACERSASIGSSAVWGRTDRGRRRHGRTARWSSSPTGCRSTR